jgi:hypothetical protein
VQVQAVLDDNFDPDSITQECVPVDTAELWWAGKKMTRDKLLSDFVGRNDKTKVQAAFVALFSSHHRDDVSSSTSIIDFIIKHPLTLNV